jgi:hypothetical protein
LGAGRGGGGWAGAEGGGGAGMDGWGCGEVGVADGLEVEEERVDVRILLRVSICSDIEGGGTLTIRYASLRNSSAVVVDGGRGSPLGIVVLACLSLTSWLMSEVMSVISK